MNQSSKKIILTAGGHKAIYDGAYAMGASIIDLAEKNLWDKL